MAQFNLETAVKIISLFAGNYEELNLFLTIVKLINDTLPTTQKKLVYWELHWAYLNEQHLRNLEAFYQTGTNQGK